MSSYSHVSQRSAPAEESRAEDLFACFAAGRTERPFVVAQLGQSLDGRIATVSGDSRYISGDAALDHLHRLRAHVDAVVVGIGTVLADDPRLTVRRVKGSNPARVVIDRSGRAPRDAQLFVEDGTPRIVLGARATTVPAGAEFIAVPEQGALLDPRAVIAALGRRGFRRILIEGGARTISCFIEAGCVDRLHVLVAPVLIGSGKPALELRPIDRLAEALRPATRAHLLPGGDVLFDCDLRRSRHPESLP